MQVKKLHSQIDLLQKKYGGENLCSIYGAGCVRNPKAMFVFMNPTAKNISAHKAWNDLRAPWLGTKNIWKLLCEVGIISIDTYKNIKSFGL